MFIQCSDCDYKYLVNSADLKPNGRMVECSNCSNQWFQNIPIEDELLTKSLETIEISESDNNLNDSYDKKSKKIKNLPSTIVKEQKVSIINSALVIAILVMIISGFWSLRIYGTNIFVLINYYIHEFFFNFKLIINDLSIIIHQILN